MRFSPTDGEVVRQLVFVPTAEPSFELMKSCLVWPDGLPLRISRAGYELLGDLWIVRGFLHRQIQTEKWGLYPAHFQEVWRSALQDVPDWPGFKRLQLSQVDRDYLDRCLKQPT